MMTTKKSPATKGSPPPIPPKGATTHPPATKARPTGEPTIVLAAVTGPHGIGGEVKLKLFADDVGAFTSFNDGALTLRSLRGNIARFAEVPDRTAAEALRGTQLTVPRSALPPLEEGEYYHADLIGLPAASDAGEPIGHVVAVENFGAGDVIEIERPNGKRFMVPMNEHAVPDWSGEGIVVAEAFAAD